jgi:surfeit locus 1 family protein
LNAAPARRVFPAAAATGIALCILIALGVWQLQRREWKAGILAAIDTAESGPPVALGATPPPFAKVFVSGVLQPGRALYGIDVRDQMGGPPREGAQLVGVLRRADGPDVVVVLGWVPAGDGAPDPLKAAGAASREPATIQGYIRAPDHPNWLSAADDPEKLHFYTLDARAIGLALGARNVAPFTLVAMGKQGSPDAPVPADALPRPPNNHLEYAFTWFGLAAALVGVFLSWLFRLA